MDKSTKNLTILGFIYLIFVIYGSWVPLNFTPISPSEAWDRFSHIRYLQLGIGSRADWVANILLFIPLAFLGIGIIWHRRNTAFNIIGSFIILAASISLCILIEYTQLYFPPRTVSLNDILAESLGAVIGITLWWLTGEKVKTWLNSWFQSQSKTDRIQRALHFYLVILFVYNVMPLDLTISPIELYHKWNEGRIMLIPFGFHFAEPSTLIYNLITDMLIWIPVPILLIISSPHRKLYAFNYTVLSALLIEIAQLFVYSRVTDITDIITAILGAGAGLWLAGKVINSLNRKTGSKRGEPNPPVTFILFGGAVFVVWSLILAVIFWYPFNFRLEQVFIADRFASFLNAPFTSYYYGTEFRALTEVLHKVIFFTPLGIVLAVVVQNLENRSLAHTIKWLGFLLILAIATAIEMVQLALPDKFPNNTDIIIEVCGGIFGYWLLQFIQGRFNPVLTPDQYESKNFSNPYALYTVNQSTAGQRKIKTPKTTLPQKTTGNSLTSILPWIAVVAVILYATLKLPFVPYNVKELISGDIPWLNCIGLSVFLFWCFGFPIWFFDKIFYKPYPTPLHLFSGTSIHVLVACFLLLISAPTESLHDIVGSPILANIPHAVETYIRLTALLGILSLCLFGAAIISNTALGARKNILLYYLIGAGMTIILIPVYYWGIVLQAATDNLIELLPSEGRSWLTLLIIIYLILITAISAITASITTNRQWQKLVWLIPVLFISYPVGFWLLQTGTEQYIYKYGKVFSALQFLLSSDRDHYIEYDTLQMKFYIAHSAFLITLAITQWPMWISVRRNRLTAG